MLVRTCAALLVRWVALPLLHVAGLLLVDHTGVAPALQSDLAQRFVLLAEGAVPSSMTILAIAVQQKNVAVEKLLGIVLLSQYLVSAVVSPTTLCPLPSQPNNALPLLSRELWPVLSGAVFAQALTASTWLFLLLI